MENQLTHFKMFLDINSIHDIDGSFRNIVFHMKNNGKKRIYVNQTVVKYLRNEQLTEEEKQLILEINSGTFFKKKNHNLEHCMICSGALKFEILPNLSNNNQYWNIGIPTQQYSPFGFMTYLKQCNHHKKERFLDLDYVEMKELLLTMKQIYHSIHNSNFKYEIVGVNVMFNQITVSQRCIHGHIELMIKDPHLKKIGVTLEENISVDPIISMVCKRDKLHYPFGLKIDDIEKYSFSDLHQIISDYFKEIYTIIEEFRNKKYSYQQKKNNFSQQDIRFMNQLSPTPVANVYLAYYQNKYQLVITPEIFLRAIHPQSIQSPEDYYCLKYNGDCIDKNYILLFEKAPIMRPSIKINCVDYDLLEYHQEQERIIKILERR